MVSLTATDSSGSPPTTSQTTLSVSGAPSAIIATVPTSVAVGTSVTLDGTASASGATGSLVISGYQWIITGGTARASLTGDTGPIATLIASGPGTVTVNLTVTDSAGQHDTISTSFTAVGAPVVAPPTSSGGGGAMELGWLLGWLASVIGVWVVTPRPGRQAA